MKILNQIPLHFRIIAINSFGLWNQKFKVLLLMIALFSIQQLSSAQNFTVTITTDYCSVPGSVKLIANPDPALNNYSFSWNTSPVQTTRDIVVNVAGQYSVTVKNEGGDEVTQTLNISSNLVVNGDFELGNVGFTTSYIYAAPAPNALIPENRYTIDWDPHFSHKYFWGRDHTTNTGNLMIVNGVAFNSVVWSQQINNILPNTDYYFSAYGISLNASSPFANLQFSINGSQVGTTTGPLPPHHSNNNPPYNWIHFYGVWNSGNSDLAKLSIVDIEPGAVGNDFGLDDISFGTITPMPLAINVSANTPCDGDALQLSTIINGGKYPYSYSWTGPAGFESDMANPVIPNVSMANAGIYTVNVTDGNSCSPPVSKSITVLINPAITGGIVTGGSSICKGSTGSLFTLSGNSGSVIKWQSSIDPFISWTDIPNTETTFTSGILDQTTHFRAVIQSGSCVAYSGEGIVTVDNTPPTITTKAENKTVECDGNNNSAELNAWLGSNGGAVASDDVSGITWSNNFSSLTILCGASGSANVTFTAKDNCGNISATSALFTIADNSAPILSNPPANVTVECNSIPEAATLTALDNCDAAPVVIFKEARTNGSCANSYIITRTWTATDACLNTSSVSQIVTVRDVTAPVLSCTENISVNNDPGICGAALTVPKPSVAENCGSVTLSNNFNQTSDASGLYPIGTTTIVWKATDECGNTATCEFTVVVNDNEKPAISCPADISLCSGEQPLLVAATATDNCGILSIVNNAPTVFPEGTTLVIWTATDIHGNITTCTQAVNINPKMTANAGPDAILCSTLPYSLSAATAVSYSSVSWSHNGHGSLSGSAILNPTYTPSDGETGSIEFTLTAKGTSVCGNTDISDTFVLTIYPALNVNAGEDRPIDQGTSTTLSGQVSGGSKVYVYTWLPADYLVDNAKLNPVTVPLNTATVFTFNVLDEVSRCTKSDDVRINVNNIARPIARDDYDTTYNNPSVTVNVKANDSDPIGLGLTTSITVNPVKGIAILNENGTITYTPEKNTTGKDINDTLTYRICDKGNPSECATAKLIITVSFIRVDEAFEIFNLVTPNGDGHNDYWHIGGIDAFPVNEVILFNRWGDKIKEFKNYNNSDNRWIGTNEKNEYLPDGVYFYLIKIKDQDTRKGWVYVRGKGDN